MTEIKDPEALTIELADRYLPPVFNEWMRFMQSASKEAVIFLFPTPCHLEKCISEWRKEEPKEAYNVLRSWFDSHLLEVEDKRDARAIKITFTFKN